MEAASFFETLLSVHQRTWLKSTISTAVITQNLAHGSHPENMKVRIS
jgi:hypothetical protein